MADPKESDPRKTWQTALPNEIEFWEKFLASGGLEWGWDYQNRISPDTPLQKVIVEHLSHLRRSEFSILDVGAGPLTMVGKRWPGRTIRITAVDPLADEYARILAQLRIKPLVQTLPCEGEVISERFLPNSFDLVWAQNSLDHSYDPAVIIDQALRVVKVGCYVILVHKKNEGETESYAGLHQWNFTEDAGRFIIWNKAGSTDMTRHLKPYAEVAIAEDQGWLTVVIRKRRLWHVRRTLASAKRHVSAWLQVRQGSRRPSLQGHSGSPRPGCSS